MRKISFALALLGLASPLAAQTSPQVSNDLTVNMSPQQYRICNDRPARPIWMDEVHVREAYKALTLMDLYELRAWEKIAELDDCSCETRFPSWDSTEAEYQEHFADLSQADQSAFRREWIEKRKQLEPLVRGICEAQGNW